MERPQGEIVDTGRIRAKSSYLKGEDHTSDKDFIGLIDPKNPVKLEIIDSDSVSYPSYTGDLVHIANMTRRERSAWGGEHSFILSTGIVLMHNEFVASVPFLGTENAHFDAA